MIENNNFPWYLQQTETFSTLYYAFFPIAEAASPLGVGDAFNVDAMTGKMLYRLGTYWGLSGSPSLWDGLIYDVDNWSDIKTWTGGIRDIGEEMYRNLIKAKAYANGNLYSLKTLKEVLDRVFGDNPHYISVDEQDMGITINIISTQDAVRAFTEIRAFDLSFLGKPIGINVVWNYGYMDQHYTPVNSIMPVASVSPSDWAWIDTDVVFDELTVAEIDTEIPDTTSQWVLGGSTAIQVCLRSASNVPSNRLLLKYGTETIETDMPLLERAVITIDNGVFSINSATYGTTYTGSLETQPNFGLFAVLLDNDGKLLNNWPTRLHSAKFYKYTDNTRTEKNLIANFIPVVRTTDNAVGLYNTVSGNFFENANTTGRFLAITQE